jgi:hypothetical protein
VDSRTDHACSLRALEVRLSAGSPDRDCPSGDSGPTSDLRGVQSLGRELQHQGNFRQRPHFATLLLAWPEC